MYVLLCKLNYVNSHHHFKHFVHVWLSTVTNQLYHTQITVPMQTLIYYMQYIVAYSKVCHFHKIKMQEVIHPCKSSYFILYK